MESRPSRRRQIACDTGANGEWQCPKLRRPHLDMKIDDESRNQSEGDLRDDKPAPVDALIQDRADDPQR